MSCPGQVATASWTPSEAPGRDHAEQTLDRGELKGRAPLVSAASVISARAAS